MFDVKMIVDYSEFLGDTEGDFVGTPINVTGVVAFVELVIGVPTKKRRSFFGFS